MSVLKEILDWSQDRPPWQRDALRRLVLAKEHIPDTASGAAPVSLVSIFHHRGVNALAENQTLKFSAFWQ